MTIPGVLDRAHVVQEFGPGKRELQQDGSSVKVTVTRHWTGPIALLWRHVPIRRALEV